MIKPGERHKKEAKEKSMYKRREKTARNIVLHTVYLVVFSLFYIYLASFLYSSFWARARILWHSLHRNLFAFASHIFRSAVHPFHFGSAVLFLFPQYRACTRTLASPALLSPLVKKISDFRGRVYCAFGIKGTVSTPFCPSEDCACEQE